MLFAFVNIVFKFTWLLNVSPVFIKRRMRMIINLTSLLETITTLDQKLMCKWLRFIDIIFAFGPKSFRQAITTTQVLGSSECMFMIASGLLRLGNNWFVHLSFFTFTRPGNVKKSDTQLNVCFILWSYRANAIWFGHWSISQKDLFDFHSIFVVIEIANKTRVGQYMRSDINLLQNSIFKSGKGKIKTFLWIVQDRLTNCLS